MLAKHFTAKPQKKFKSVFPQVANLCLFRLQSLFLSWHNTVFMLCLGLGSGVRSWGQQNECLWRVTHGHVWNLSMPFLFTVHIYNGRSVHTSKPQAAVKAATRALSAFWSFPGVQQQSAIVGLLEWKLKQILTNMQKIEALVQYELEVGLMGSMKNSTKFPLVPPLQLNTMRKCCSEDWWSLADTLRSMCFCSERGLQIFLLH